MTTPLENIDDYFAGRLSDNEKVSFEKRCETDPEFAEEVGFYISTRDALKQIQLNEKKKEFEGYYHEFSASGKNGRDNVIRLIPYLVSAVAACLVLFFGLNFLFNSPSPEKLASGYINENLQNLSVTMGGTEDTLQLGIAAYNKGAYQEAEQYFVLIKENENFQSEAIKFLGLTYLKTGDYNKAIDQFNILSGNKNLYANPGPFYKAVTLMKRSGQNDREEAKRLLTEVVDKDLPGKKHAEKWLEKLR